VSQFDSAVSVYAYEADEVRFFNVGSWGDPGGYDEVLVPPLRDMLAASKQNLFVALHTMGSHSRYTYRYPPAFEIFKPAAALPSSSDAELANAYDNSILYTDHLIAEVIAELRATGAIAAVFYTSDHGEDLPNQACRQFGHGYPDRPNFLIPALYWYSDAYARAYPERVRQLREHANARLTTENTFESMIDLAGLTFPGHDTTRSIVNPAFVPRQRLVNAMGVVDFDHALFGHDCQTVIPAP
jgi:glucan phosphoethanolaminetransferase (alkaline phosphatase superfamily)